MPAMLNMTEAAAYLGISMVKLWQMVRDGEITYSTDALDKRVKLFRQRDLDKFKNRSIRKEKKSA